MLGQGGGGQTLIFLTLLKRLSNYEKQIGTLELTHPITFCRPRRSWTFDDVCRAPHDDRTRRAVAPVVQLSVQVSPPMLRSTSRTKNIVASTPAISSSLLVVRKRETYHRPEIGYFSCANRISIKPLLSFQAD